MLGTTPQSLDVGMPSGDDVHLDMVREPRVSIAEPSDASAIAAGDEVAIVSSDDTPRARVRAIVLVSDAVHFVPAGRYAWDAPGGRSMTAGRIARCERRGGGALALEVRYPGGRRRLIVSPEAQVVALRPGSRSAFLNPHAVFVFATPPTDGLSLVLQSAVVGDGTLSLPF